LPGIFRRSRWRNCYREINVAPRYIFARIIFNYFSGRNANKINNFPDYAETGRRDCREAGQKGAVKLALTAMKTTLNYFQIGLSGWFLLKPASITASLRKSLIFVVLRSTSA
jgi:hypothetical protein